MAFKSSDVGAPVISTIFSNWEAAEVPGKNVF